MYVCVRERERVYECMYGVVCVWKVCIEGVLVCMCVCVCVCVCMSVCVCGCTCVWYT